MTIRIPKDLQKILEKLGKKQGRSTSEVARECLRRYADILEFRRLRERMRPCAEAKGFLTDEDVFKAVS